MTSTICQYCGRVIDSRGLWSHMQACRGRSESHTETDTDITETDTDITETDTDIIVTDTDITETDPDITETDPDITETDTDITETDGDLTYSDHEPEPSSYVTGLVLVLICFFIIPVALKYGWSYLKQKV